MAKWGEGDPRWIVEERPDATNVNNWHWTEKDATIWSKDMLHKLFQDMKIDDSEVECSIDEIEKCSGEATANNRKGKLIFFYEWQLVMKWSGRLNKGCDKRYIGRVTIPNLSEENDIDEVEITITTEESCDVSEVLKRFMYNFGREKIRHQLGVYIKELKEEYSKGLILPRKGEENVAQTASKEDLKRISGFKNNITNEKAAENILGCKMIVETLIMAKEFQCRANDLYKALTKVDMVEAFTQGPAKIDACRGGEFSLYGGNIQGKFEELIPEKKICQTWRLKNWPTGHYSNVTIELNEMKSNTKMTLKQTGIPAKEYHSMKVNWNRYYWNAIKLTFGFGVALMDSL